MTPVSLLLGAGIAAAVTLLGLMFVVLSRAIREGRRVARRLAALGSSPLGDRIERARRDLDRINAALERLPPLEARGRAAFTVVRTKRFVPPEIAATVERVGGELTAFRRERR